MSDDDNKFTIDKLKSMRRLLFSAGRICKEVYPQAWKKIPELNEICEARIKNGLGVWNDFVLPDDEPAEK